jgi:hypothetical protein
LPLLLPLLLPFPPPRPLLMSSPPSLLPCCPCPHRRQCHQRHNTPLLLRRIAPALAALAVVFAVATLPPLLLMLPPLLIFWLIVMFPQPRTLSPLLALSHCR